MRALQKRVIDYLAQEKIIPSNELLPGAIDDSLAREAMKEMNVVVAARRGSRRCRSRRAIPSSTTPKRIEEYVDLFKL